MRKGTKLERPQAKETLPRFPRGEKQPYTPDALLDNLMPTLTEDQRCYIENHRGEKRSVMARKLAISKLSLNHYLGGLSG